MLRMELGQQSLSGKERKGIHKGVREEQLEIEEKPWVWGTINSREIKDFQHRTNNQSGKKMKGKLHLSKVFRIFIAFSLRYISNLMRIIL